MLFCYSQNCWKMHDDLSWRTVALIYVTSDKPNHDNPTHILSEWNEREYEPQSMSFCACEYALDVNIGYASDLMHRYAWISLFDPFYAKPLYSFSSGEQVCVHAYCVSLQECVSVCVDYEKSIVTSREQIFAAMTRSSTDFCSVLWPSAPHSPDMHHLGIFWLHEDSWHR